MSQNSVKQARPNLVLPRQVWGGAGLSESLGAAAASGTPAREGLLRPSHSAEHLKQHPHQAGSVQEGHLDGQGGSLYPVLPQGTSPAPAPRPPTRGTKKS